jgi:hypothetical protein
MNQMRTFVSLALIGGLLTACGAGDSAETTTTLGSVPTTVAGVTTTGFPGDPEVDPGLADSVAFAVSDLSERLRVPVSEVGVVSAQSVTWPDGSMGCPQEGEMYTQAVVDGYQIGLQHGDRFFAYHGANGDDPFLCPSAEKDGGYGFVPPPGFGSEN